MPSRFLRWNLWLTDLGFLAYWTVTALHALPPEWLYRDHDDPVMVAWNWSFAPIDLAASALGLWGLRRASRGDGDWRTPVTLSIALTFAAGAMALSFWALRGDFDPGWWAPNAYLVAWPVIAVRALSWSRGMEEVGSGGG